MVAIRAYSGLRNESLPSLQQSNLLDRLTRVVLLANPAHQTALNSRKKLVQKNIMQPHWELGFSGSLLSCRECTKESILWHHRRWLLHVIYGVPATAGTDSVPETVPVDALEAEFACASTACHLYPRNYHAWAHRRFCAEALVAPLYPEVPSKSGALVKEYQWTLKWIESHVSDYSAMNHAVNFEQMLAGGKPTGLRLSTKVHAASLLRSYPDHESLWMYLRGSIPNEDEDKDEEFAPMKGAPSVQKFALRHVIWRKIFVSLFFLPPIVSCLKNETSKVKRFPSGHYVAHSLVIILRKRPSNRNPQLKH